MFARRCLLSKRASQSGTGALCGGLSGLRGPCDSFSGHTCELKHGHPSGGVLVGCCSGAHIHRAVPGLRDAGGELWSRAPSRI